MNAVTVTQIKAPSISLRADIFGKLSSGIPLNEFGLPKYFYRSDLIAEDFNGNDDADKAAILNGAKISISYAEGYPTFPSGRPLWEQMDDEDSLDFERFNVYKSQQHTLGYRQLYLLSRDPSIASPSIDQLNELYILNYWSYRVKAHDLFIAALHRKMRENRLMSLENTQFMESQRFLDTLSKQMPVIFGDDRLQALTPVEAITIYERLWKIQQKALGAHSGANGKASNKNQDTNDAPPNASLELTMRSVARQSGAVTVIEQTNGDNADSDAMMEMLQRDPQSVGMAQELHIRLSLGSKGQKPGGASTQADSLSPSARVAVYPAEVQAPHGETKKRVALIDATEDQEPEVIPIDDLDRQMMGT